MTSPEVLLGPYHDWSFETARIDAHDDVPISAREAMLNEERDPSSDDVAKAASDE